MSTNSSTQVPQATWATAGTVTTTVEAMTTSKTSSLSSSHSCASINEHSYDPKTNNHQIAVQTTPTANCPLPPFSLPPYFHGPKESSNNANFQGRLPQINNSLISMCLDYEWLFQAFLLQRLWTHCQILSTQLSTGCNRCPHQWQLLPTTMTPCINCPTRCSIKNTPPFPWFLPPPHIPTISNRESRNLCRRTWQTSRLHHSPFTSKLTKDSHSTSNGIMNFYRPLPHLFRLLLWWPRLILTCESLLRRLLPFPSKETFLNGNTKWGTFWAKVDLASCMREFATATAFMLLSSMFRKPKSPNTVR